MYWMGVGEEASQVESVHVQFRADQLVSQSVSHTGSVDWLLHVVCGMLLPV
jgi:hypothetical protein